MTVILLFFGLCFLGFGNCTESDIPLTDDTFIIVNTVVRDSNGSLVLFQEATKFTDVNYPLLDDFLDYESGYGYQTITLDGSQYQMIRRVQSFVYQYDDFRVGTALHSSIDGNPILVRFAHDGYFVYKGETLYLIWTFLRPL